MMNREHVEQAVQNAVQWLRLAVETTGAVVVAVGVMLALWGFVRAFLAREHFNFNAVRLVLARYLALALEFQLGSDILSTAIAPTWDQIGRLGVIAVIRTALNFFLGREIEAERSAESKSQQPVSTSTSGSAQPVQSLVAPGADGAINGATDESL